MPKSPNSKFSKSDEKKQFFYDMVNSEPTDIYNILKAIENPKLKDKIKIIYDQDHYIFTLDEIFTYLLDIINLTSRTAKRKYSLFLVVQILKFLYENKLATLSKEQIVRYESKTVQEIIEVTIDEGILLEMQYDKNLKKLLSTVKKCKTCGKGEDDFVVQKNYCPCKKAIYCSRECQLKDWKEHQKVCPWK